MSDFPAELLHAYEYETGSVGSLCKKFNAPVRAFRNYVSKNGLTRKHSRYVNFYKKNPVDYSIVEDDWVNSTRSISDIALQLGVQAKTLCQHFKRLGIERTNPLRHAAKDTTVIDYSQVEAEYRAGVISELELAKRVKSTVPKMREYFDRQGIARDVEGRVRAKAHDIVLHQAIVGDEPKSITNLVQRNAELQAEVTMNHRHITRELMNLGVMLFEELRFTTINYELMQCLGELQRKENMKGEDKLNDLYKKSIESPVRINSFDKMSNAMRTLINLERVIHGIDNSKNEEDELSRTERSKAMEHLRELSRKALRQSKDD